MSEPMKQENLEVAQSETRTCIFQNTEYVRERSQETMKIEKERKRAIESPFLDG